MTPIKIYLASGNPAKRIEIQKHLQSRLKHVELLGAESLGGMPPVEENAPDFKGNALLKARALASLAPPNAWVLADDSGLEVATLNGAPGVRSARYAGEKVSSTDNLKKLLAALSNTPENQRTAELVCHFALLGPRNSDPAQARKPNEASEPQDEQTPSHKSAEQFRKSAAQNEPQDNRELFKPCIEQHFEGRVSGRILNSVRGELGFGYDPVFVPEGHTQSFAELGLEAKNKISHRARACTMLLEWLRQLD